MTPGDPHFALAAKYAESGLAAQAWDLIKDRLAAPDVTPDVLGFGAGIAYAAGEPATALALTDAAISAGGEGASLWFVRGATLRLLNRLEESAAAYERATGEAPGVPEAWNDLGLVREALGDLAGATAALEQAIAVQPDFAPAHANLGALYADAGQFAAAAEYCRKALASEPSNIGARINLAAAQIERGRHDEAADALAPIAADPAAADTGLYLLHYCSNHPAAIFRAHAGWGARAPAPETLTYSETNGARQRIGYVSHDFRRHSVSYFFEPLLRHHDRARVEVFCYSTGGQPDAVTARLRAHADHWHDISGLSDDEACQLIRGHGLDVLIDLSGHTKGNRLGIFARRAAAVQITALGYPGTTGLTQIDGRFVDAITDPGGAEAFATERLLRLPRLHCYQPEETAPAVAPLPAAAAGHITFGSFNKLGKVSDATVALWSAVLHAVPQSKLFIKSKALAEETTRQATAARFAAHDVAADRLMLVGWVPEDAGHLATYGRIDVALDTFPYSGTTTTCEALWMGVPVLTLAGATHASRVSASLLTSVGLTEWIAGTAEEFVVKAVTIAAELEGLAMLRSGLRAQIASSPLCDGPGYAAAVEAAYRAY